MSEYRRIETSLIQLAIQKPQPKEVVGQLLAVEPFAAHRIECNEDAALEQLLGWNRRPSFLGIKLIEEGRESGQHLIDLLFDATQRVVGRHALVEVDRRQELRLRFSFSTHADPIASPLLLFNLFESFSAACERTLRT